MKATGIVRRIDDLGRVVIPKEIRRTMRIREGDPLQRWGIYAGKKASWGGSLFFIGWEVLYEKSVMCIIWYYQ